MTHRWGFDLDMAAVRLMRREAGQWHEIIVEKIDGPDIEDRLRSMVERVGDAKAVDLFLPRDQILYTDVTVSSEDDALDDIDKAMAGRTPYALNELEYDWEMTGPSTARVAAIARETLDEAAAFAEARGLRVAGFSSLADTSDFPRLPDFGGDGLFDDDDAESEDKAIAVDATPFATRRETSRSNGPVASLTPTSEPVVRVEDSTPVMQVRSRDSAPLDPGAPLDAPPVAPRVRTDIAAAAVSPHAASLTPPPALSIRRPAGAPLRTAGVFLVALILTIGIAIVVWNILPLRPGQTSQVEEPVAPEIGLLTPKPRPVDLVPQTETAALPPEIEESATDEPEPEVLADPGPDLPRPEVYSDMVEFALPTLGTAPSLASLAPAPQSSSAPALLQALRSGEGVPDYDPEPPLSPTPRSLANAMIAAPLQSLDLEAAALDETGAIQVAVVERASPLADILALASVGAFDANDLPFVQNAPAPPAPAEVADTPTLAPEEIIAEVEPAEDLSAAIEAATEEALGSVDEPQVPTFRLPAPTELAASLEKRAPRARPAAIVQPVEPETFNGLAREQLASVRPPRRPETAPTPEAAAPPSALAVSTSLAPRGRPDGFDRLVANALAQRQAQRLTASLDYQAPDTSAAIEAALEADAEPEPRPQDTPRLVIPSNASVARQATIDNAIRLNKINLVGVYGTSADRRALIRLASGRYVKVKVGDRVDGGTVARITDDELIYRKGSRNISLSMPRG